MNARDHISASEYPKMPHHVGVVSPPPGLTADYDYSNPWLYNANISLISIGLVASFLCLTLRIYTKTRILHRLGWEDGKLYPRQKRCPPVADSHGFSSIHCSGMGKTTGKDGISAFGLPRMTSLLGVFSWDASNLNLCVRNKPRSMPYLITH